MGKAVSTARTPGAAPVIDVDRAPAHPTAVRPASRFERLPRVPATFVPRPRLVAVLDECTQKPVTVLVAPAGSGKSAALAGWAAEPGRDVRWLGARRGEASDVLVAGLLDAVGETDTALLRLASGAAGDDTIDDDTLVALLSTTTGVPRVLVVDDAHRLDAQSWALLDTVLDRAPDRVRLVLATRRDAPLPVVDLELAQVMTTVRADRLRLDDDEAGLLVRMHAPDIDDDDVVALQSRAHGWAAALVLGARRLSAAPDRAASRAALERTEQPVLDYLLGDVFTTVPEATRQVLLATAGESAVTESAAILLSGDPYAAEHLSSLAAGGMLVTRHDEGIGPTWHYHPLLDELLRRQVAPEGPDHETARVAHRRAAHHYASHGPAVLALRHATAAADHDLMLTLLLDRGVALLAEGHVDQVSDALRRLPEDVVATEPALLGVNALALRAAGDVESAVRMAVRTSEAGRAVRQRIAAGGPAAATTVAERTLVADAAILDLWLARFGWHDVQEAMTDARRVLGESDQNPAADARTDVRADARPSGTPLLEPARLAWLLDELAVMETWLTETADASRHADAALLTAQGVGLPWMSAAALANRSVLQLLEGEFQTAADTAHAALAAADPEGSPGRDLARPHIALAWAAYYDLRLDEAAAELHRTGGPETAAADPMVLALARVLEARLVAERGDVQAARRMLTTLPPHPEPLPVLLDAMFAVVRAHWALDAGDVDEARRQVPVMRAAGREISALTFSGVLHDLTGDPATARHELQAALALPAAGEQQVCATFAAVYLARLHLAAGRRGEALLALRDALTRAAPQRLLHPLLASAAAGPACEALLTDLAGGPDAHPFAAYVVEARSRYRRPHPDLGVHGARRPGSVDRRARPGGPARTTVRRAEAPFPSMPAPQPLTGRETDVLIELSLGGSYADIATALFVTENTVKTHMAAIYRKLGVERRADALRRARDLGLI